MEKKLKQEQLEITKCIKVHTIEECNYGKDFLLQDGHCKGGINLNALLKILCCSIYRHCVVV